MSHPLEASRAKVREAYETLARLDAAIQGIFDPGPYKLIAEFDPNTRQHTVRAKRLADLPLIQWGVLVGGIAHDLRSALNYVITALVRANGGTPGRQHEFPIFEDEALYLERDTKGRPTRKSGLYRVEGVSEAAATFIEGLQPYNRLAQATTPTEFTYSYMWALHELNRVDKHQDAIVPTPIVRSVEVTMTPPLTVDEHIMPGPLEDDAILFRWTEPPGVTRPVTMMGVAVPRSAGAIAFQPGGQMSMPMHAHFTFDVAFAQSGPTKGDLVLESLTGIADRVAETIEAFVPFLSSGRQ